MKNYILIFLIIGAVFSKDVEEMFFSVYFNDIKAGDVIECFTLEEVAPKI